MARVRGRRVGAIQPGLRLQGACVRVCLIVSLCRTRYAAGELPLICTKKYLTFRNQRSRLDLEVDDPRRRAVELCAVPWT